MRLGKKYTASQPAARHHLTRRDRGYSFPRNQGTYWDREYPKKGGRKILKQTLKKNKAAKRII